MITNETRNNISSMLARYGFSLHCIMNSEEQLYNYIHIHNGINLNINFDKNSFSMVYVIPNSIMTIECLECSPFYEETPKYKQFPRMYSKMLDIIDNYKRGAML